MPFLTRTAAACCSVAALAAVGCGGGPPPHPQTHPVTGTLLVNGKPAEGATVLLRPIGNVADKSALPSAKTDAKGEFTVSTYGSGDGAPAGDYALTLYWPVTTQDGGETVEGKDRLNDQYRSADRPARKVAVAAGPNQIPPIELTTR